MEIRKGKSKDINNIVEIIKDSIIDMESNGIYQWDDIYPNKEVIIEDINNSNLYVYIDENIIKGVVTLNEVQDNEYKSIEWKYNIGKILIVHRLCVNPKYKGNGIATTLMKYAEKVAKDNEYNSIRLDAFAQNKGACKLYEKNGYKKRGSVFFRKGEFICLEKEIKI